MGFFGKQARVEEEDNILEAVPVQEKLPDLPEPPSSTVVAPGATIIGTMKGEGIIQVEGTVEGEIDLKGVVIVAPGGLVKGPVTADTVRIAGRIEGRLTVRDHLFIERTGSLLGDFSTVSLVVEDGGQINGTATMGGGKSKKS